MRKLFNLTVYNLHNLFKMPSYFLMIISYLGLLAIFYIYCYPLDIVEATKYAFTFGTIIPVLRDYITNEVLWLTLLPTSAFIIYLSKFIAGYITVLLMTLLFFAGNHFTFNFSIDSWYYILSASLIYLIVFCIYCILFRIKRKG